MQWSRIPHNRQNVAHNQIHFVQCDMNIKFLLDLYSKRKFGNGRALTTSTLIKYYVKLKIGEVTKRIYKIPKNSSPILITNTVEALEIIESSIRKSLSEMNLGNVIDITRKIGLENIGMGCVLTPAMFGNLIALTQNNTSFYFKTDETKEYMLKMDLLAIASISGHIKFEKEIIHSFSFPTLTEHKLSLIIKAELVTNKISKITILVDKCWSPHFLDKDLPDFPLGIGIRLIEFNDSMKKEIS